MQDSNNNCINASIFRRKISPFERLYLASQKILPPFAIQICIEGTGMIEIQNLQAAVACVAQLCPGTRLVLRGKNWVDSGKPPPVRAIEIDNFDGYTFGRLPVLCESLEPHQGPTCEVILVRSRENTTLVFRASHAVMDGRGALYWVEEVFRALRGEALLGAKSILNETELLSQITHTAQRRKLGFNSLPPLRSDSLTNRSFFWKRRTIAGSHPALVAKLASLISTFANYDTLRFMVPVDLRHHAHSVQSTANLSLPIFLNAQKGERWEQLQERILKSLSQKEELARDGSEWGLSKLPLIGIEFLVRFLLGHQKLRKKYMASAILSNLGKIKLNSFSCSGFNPSSVYALPVHTALVPLSFVAVECSEHIELTVSCPIGNGLEQELDELLDHITAALLPSNVGMVAQPWAGNETKRVFPNDKTIIELFQERVKISPKALALICNSRSMTYEKLNCAANAVSYKLRERNIGPGDIVSLFADRTEKTIAGLLGILQAGAAYLPIDPKYPDERVKFMLSDSGSRLCLTQKEYTSRLADFFEGECFVLEEIDMQLTLPPLKLSAKPNDLVYVIYTSGSSGIPKGVQIEHRNLVNYIDWAINTYKVDEDKKFALFSSLSFDLSVTVLFLPLIAGGSVELFPEELNHIILREIIESGRVNVLKVTPIHLELMSRLKIIPSQFHFIIVGGEQLKGSVAKKAQEIFGPACKIINMYGPTETTIGCIAHVFNPLLDANLAAVPIGTPIGNTQIFIMDSAGNPVELGKAGEILIAGEGLSRGYLNREALTKEKFVQLKNGKYAYKTGDLARILPNGDLEFLGRIDDQIKIRGHRIEPGEIAAVLMQHPSIEQAVVLARKRGEDEEVSLCAYFVVTASIYSSEMKMQQGASERRVYKREAHTQATSNDAASSFPMSIDESALRAYLEKKLPRYMLPSFFVRVESIPITINGKVDIKSLSSVDMAYSSQSLPSSAEKSILTTQLNNSYHHDEVEHAIATIWAEVLERDTRFTADSNFFHLGGDSLKMIKMLSAISRTHIAQNNEEIFMKSIGSFLITPTFANICQTARESRYE